MDISFFKQHPELANLSPEKMQFLINFANQNKSGNAKEMSNLILNAMQSAKKQGIQFDSTETNIIIEILKQNMSPEEQRKANQILLLLQHMKRN